MEEKATRKRRTVEERAQAIEEKIQAENERHQEALAKLKDELKRITTPKLTKAQKHKKVLDAIKDLKMSPEELIEKLNLDLEL